jgi:Mrp family chromosome partitioning ATPase
MEAENVMERAHRALQRVYPRARMAQPDPKHWHENRIVLPQERGPAVNAYRMLRTQVLRQARALQARTIGIVSAADGEGKTLTAVNLALSLAAEPNQTVLLVDLDLHRPGVARLLDLPADQGLEDWLAGSGPIAGRFWRIQGIERLSILPAVVPVSGSSELLAGAPVKELLQDLKSRYEDRLVVIDLPPALLSDAVLTVAPLLDAVLVVGCEGRTRREDLARLREVLSGVRLLGTVLNCASEFERRAY